MKIRLVLLLLLIPIIAAANGGVITNFPNFLTGITGFFSKMSIALLSLPIIFGAYQIITAGGDPEKIEHGKKMIIYALIGVSILLFANATVDLIIQKFT
jgi:hypothetical protein